MKSLFSEQVKRVMQHAREECSRLGHNYIGTEHLLLGLIKEDKGKAVEILTHLNLDLKTLKGSIGDYVATSDTNKKIDEVPFTPRAKQILEIAANEAREIGSKFVDTEHILLALTKDREGVAAQILTGFGVNFGQIKQVVSSEKQEEFIQTKDQNEIYPLEKWRSILHGTSKENLIRLKSSLEDFLEVANLLELNSDGFKENKILLGLIEEEIKNREE